MAGMTKTTSPFHEKACVGGSAIIGAAVGSVVPVVGTLTGAATGAVIGLMICSRDVISKPIGTYLDFEHALDFTSSNADAQTAMINAMIERGISTDRASAAVTLKYSLAEAKKNPKKYYQTSAQASSMPPTGKVAHAIDDMKRKAQGAVKTASA